MASQPHVANTGKAVASIAMNDLGPDLVASPAAMREIVDALRADRKIVGFVPTMGNLHEGHASLIRASRSQTDVTVVSIFVNPIQFVEGEDFARYPRTLDADLALCRELGVDAVFSPSVAEFYPRTNTTRVHVHRLDERLCGLSRPGHFTGVATVVAKLFHCVPAHVAFFGMKDFQQCRVIERMVRDLDFPIELRFCPTVRETDGLARSSRNAYLSPAERKQATVLRRMLDRAEYLVKSGERSVAKLQQAMLEQAAAATLGKVDYVEIVDAESLEPIESVTRPAVAAIAVRFGGARLIDNTMLQPQTNLVAQEDLTTH